MIGAEIVSFKVSRSVQFEVKVLFAFRGQGSCYDLEGEGGHVGELVWHLLCFHVRTDADLVCEY